MSEYRIQTAEGNPADKGRNAQTEMMISRQAQEVQTGIFLAKKFPRDQIEAYSRVINACKRRKLAENATYEYPRGDMRVTGPSIRLAEALAQNWGNIDFGLIELEQKNGESQVMAYAWDLETNTRQTKIFSVKHVRYTRKGAYPLADPRDIYELIANQGARRLRSCILGVIPGDVIDGAMDQCAKTLMADEKPLVDSIRDMAQAFKEQYGVTVPQIEKYIGWKVESFSPNDLVKLRRVYTSLKDGMARKEEIFDMTVSETPVDALGAKTESRKAAKKEAKQTSAAEKKKAADGELPDDKEESVFGTGE